MPRRIALIIAIGQSILLFAHFFVYETWIAFHPGASAQAIWRLRFATILLSFTFIAASLLAWRSGNFLVRIFYTLAVVWMGFLDLLFMAAFACWIAYAMIYIARVPVTQQRVADAIFGLAVIAGVYAIINSSWTRVHRITVKLPNLPEVWRGRTAALVSDMHLGHVRNAGFMRRIVRMLQRVKPDIVFVAGDMYDGTMVDVDKVARPWSEFRRAARLVLHHRQPRRIHRPREVRARRAKSRAARPGQREGRYRRPANRRRSLHRRGQSRALPHGAATRDDRPQSPQHPPVARARSLGNPRGRRHLAPAFRPHPRRPISSFSWITSRVYGKYVHGLQRFGKMQVFTNWGAGTWGPPMRLGTQPEIVLFQFG